MEGIVGNFIIKFDDTDSLDGDSDSGSDIDGVKSFMSHFPIVQINGLMFSG
jgi:hypothetical protein